MSQTNIPENVPAPHPILERLLFKYSTKEEYMSAIMKEETGTISEKDRVSQACLAWDKEIDLLERETRQADPTVQKELKRRVIKMLQVPVSYATSIEMFLIEILNVGAALRGADTFLWIISQSNLYPDSSLFGNQMQLLKFLVFKVARAAWDSYQRTTVDQIVNDVFEEAREERYEAIDRVYEPIFNPNLMKGLRGDLIEMRVMYNVLLGQVKYIGDSMIKLRNMIEAKVEMRLQTHNAEKTFQANAVLDDMREKLEVFGRKLAENTGDQDSHRAEVESLRTKIGLLDEKVQTLISEWDSTLAREMSAQTVVGDLTTVPLSTFSETLVSSEFANLALYNKTMSIGDFRRVVENRSELYKAQIDEKKNILELKKLDMEYEACVSNTNLQKKRDLEESDVIEARKARRIHDEQTKKNMIELNYLNNISVLMAQQRQREFEEKERQLKKREVLEHGDRFSEEGDEVGQAECIHNADQKPETRISFRRHFNYFLGLIGNRS